MSEIILDGGDEGEIVLPEITPENIAKIRKVASKKHCIWFGCPRPHHAKGWCMRHYQQKRRGIVMR